MIPHATQCGQTKIKKNDKKQISNEQPYRQGVKVNYEDRSMHRSLAHDFLFNTVDKNIFKLSRNKI